MLFRSEYMLSKVYQIKVRNQIQGTRILLLSGQYRNFMPLTTKKENLNFLDQGTVILWDSTSLARNESRIKYLKPGD